MPSAYRYSPQQQRRRRQFLGSSPKPAYTLIVGHSSQRARSAQQNLSAEPISRSRQRPAVVRSIPQSCPMTGCIFGPGCPVLTTITYSRLSELYRRHLTEFVVIAYLLRLSAKRGINCDRSIVYRAILRGYARVSSCPTGYGRHSLATSEALGNIPPTIE